MPRLTGAELAEARKRSGKLGGRPRRLNRDQERERAVERLLPRALRTIEQKLDSGDSDAWRAAVALLGFAWPKPAEQVEVRTEGQLDGLSLGELQALRARLLREHPELRELRPVS